MRILQVLHGFPPEMTGGTERAVEAWSRGLVDLGHEVYVAAGSIRPAPPTRVDRDEHCGLTVFRLHREDLHYEDWWKARQPDASAAFVRLLREVRPDVVHVHHWLRLSADLVRAAKRADSVRATAVTLHDYWTVLARPARHVGEDVPRPPPVRPPMEEAEAVEAFARHGREFLEEVAAADLRFVPSRAHARGLREMGLGDLADGLEVMPPPLLDPPARRRPTGERQRRFLTWGTLYPDKGLDTVLEAVRSLDGREGLHLHVLGTAHDPEYGRRLREAAAGLPVTFGGAFTPRDLAAVEADYALLPSLCHESYGLIFDEALCLGLPVLCADVPAYRERLPDGCGRTFPPGDLRTLAGLLADVDALRALRQPAPPALVTAAESARRLAERYGAMSRSR